MNLPRSFVLLLVITTVYLSITLYPYAWEQPLVTNQAARQEGELLVFDAPGIARTEDPPAWLESALSGQVLRISLRVKPHSAAQTGPARILTVSQDPYLRNITVAQDGTDLILRLRTGETDLNGIPEHRLPNVLAPHVWRNIEIAVSPGRLRVALNGREALVRRLPTKPLARFEKSYRLAIGNELTGDRPWLGEIARAQVSTREGTVDYLAPGMLVLPTLLRWFHNQPRLLPFRHQNPLDSLLNYLGFIPLGIVLGALVSPGTTPLRRILLGTLPGLLLSLLIEVSQWPMPERYSSVNDLILNTIGAASGFFAMLARRRLPALAPRQSVHH